MSSFVGGNTRDRRPPRINYKRTHTHTDTYSLIDSMKTFYGRRINKRVRINYTLPDLSVLRRRYNRTRKCPLICPKANYRMAALLQFLVTDHGDRESIAADF